MKIKYTQEEIELLASIEKGEWKRIENFNSEKKKYQEYAANTLRKDKRVNIRMNEHDLTTIQRKALEEGIPYQTLISSLLHKYINGKLIDISSINQIRNKIS